MPKTDTPKFGEVWTWKGERYLVVGTKVRSGWIRLLAVHLYPGPPRFTDYMLWQRDLPGFEPVVGWTREEGDEYPDGDDIADSDGRLAPVGLR